MKDYGTNEEIIKDLYSYLGKQVKYKYLMSSLFCINQNVLNRVG